MRTIWLLTLVSLVACNNGADDSDDEDTDTSDDSGEETGDTPNGHPLVPEAYKFLWNTEGCETRQGGQGSQVYKLLEDGQANASGGFTATERWYWFRGTGNYDNDCYDEWTITGEFTSFDYEMLSCSQCESAYEVTRELTTSNCGLSYHRIFGLEGAPDEQEYDAIVMFDTHTPSGNPNQDNKMLVIWASHVGGPSYSPNIDYARGHAYPEVEGDDGYPAAYDWLGDACIGSGN